MQNENNRKYIYPLVTKDTSVVKGSRSLDNIIGQTESRKKLSFFVNSHSELTPFPTVLFSGSQGLGKSFMSQKVADSLDRELIEVNCATIMTSKDFIESILVKKIAGGGDRAKTILMDEAHVLSTDITTDLLTLLNPNKSNKNYLAHGGWEIEYDFAKINMIFATTDTHKMFKPLVNRCEEIYFYLYSNEELFNILCHYLPNINITCNKEDIAFACRGRARDAYLLSQNIQRYCTMYKLNVFGNKGWEDIKGIFSIHQMGLKTEEVSLLKVIEAAGQISSTNLAVKLGVNVSNIESEIEVRPRELGLIENGTRGRILTEEGKKYMGIVK
jgi:Holliday junction resolvasome RuvABC ATP-dependent DNA helicase subunit